MLDLLHGLVYDYTLRTVALGAAVLGLLSGALGAFAVLRRQSLLGDAMSHAALPGIVLAFLLTGSKAPLVLILGALAAGWLATLLIIAVLATTRLKYDSILGLALAVFFGFGLVLLTWVQHHAGASQAGLDKFLFGQAAAVVEADVVTMSLLTIVALVVLLLFWKEFKLLSFDPDYAATLGLPVRRLDILLTTLLVLAIVLGLQTVGVVLMSAMVVAPAAAARQWTDGLGKMVALSAVIGAVAGVAGAMISAAAPHLPTGPLIVLCAGVEVVISLFCAPNRGLLFRAVRERRNRRRIAADSALLDLRRLAQQHDDPRHPHSTEVLQAMSPTRTGIADSLARLAERGLVEAVEGGWVLTSTGRDRAEHLELDEGER